MFNFDNLPNRRNTNSVKWDVKENELPMFIADMDFETCPYVKEEVERIAKLGAYGYSTLPDEYYEAISSWWLRRHNVKFEKEHIIFTTGVISAISSIVRRLTHPGDYVLLQGPVYNTFFNSIENNGCHILFSDLVKNSNSYEIDWADLEEKMSNYKCRLMILCNPHNPIGKLWSEKELERIGELAYKHNVIILADEIHCDLVDPGKEYVPFARVNELNRQISITAVSQSKTFNTAGLQSACVIIPNQGIRENVYRGLNNDEVAEPNCFAVAATIAAFTKGDQWVDELNKYIYQNKCYLRDFIEKEIPEISVLPSEATYLLWVDISKITNDSEKFCSELRNKEGLIVNAGNHYKGDGEAYFRINVSTSLQNVKDACQRLKRFVKTL